MQIIKYPTPKNFTSVAQRPKIEVSQLTATVQAILKNVKNNGDKAVKQYEKEFDHTTLTKLTVTQDEIREAETQISQKLKNALLLSSQNIAKFHQAQKFQTTKIQTSQGVTCWQKSIPIQKVGLYIPGGTAPLFSTVLMLAVPAKIAGCEEIILCTPPNKQNGKIHPAILFAAKIAGVSKIFKAGGVQAIGAMAYGTETIPKVYKIFGPGNQYVMAAKQQVSLHDVAIDMPAGPSEVCVIADHTSDPQFVAADLLSQAEHGTDSQVILVSTSKSLLDNVQKEIEAQLQYLPRKEIAQQALQNSKLILVHNTSEAITLSNIYAPEHLIIVTEDYEHLAEKVINAGSVFLGKYTCESAGDYSSGTNHTLPTHGYALAYSGVNLDSYNRKVTFQYLNEQGIASIGSVVELMAENEQLEAHANAMRIRINSLKK